MTQPHPAVLAPDDLKRLTGCQRQADIEAWCQKNGVRFMRSRAGIWTTLEAVNTALGLRPGSQTRPAGLEF